MTSTRRWIARFGTTLLTISLSACDAPQPIAVRFDARLGAEPFSCRTSGSQTAADLRLFVHDLTAIDSSGKAYPVELSADERWQAANTALLDFESPEVGCDSGTNGRNAIVKGTTRARDVVAIRFTLGVPFALNHGNPAVAPPPLNAGQMSWGWQAGYKFLRFEGVDDAGKGYRFHLGSSGCEGEIGAIRECARPNRVPIEIRPFDPATQEVSFDVLPLVDKLAGAADKSCMAEAHEEACKPLFEVLGLDRTSGQPTGTPSMFRAVASAAAK